MKRLSKDTIRRYDTHRVAKHVDRFMHHHGLKDYRIDLVTRKVFKQYWPTTGQLSARLESYGPCSYRFLFAYRHSGKNSSQWMVEVLEDLYSKIDKT